MLPMQERFVGLDAAPRYGHQEGDPTDVRRNLMSERLVVSWRLDLSSDGVGLQWLVVTHLV